MARDDTGALSTLAQELQDLLAINETQVETAIRNAQPAPQSESSTASTIGSAVENVLGFGAGIGSLISGLTSLFGSGSDEAPAPLTPFLMPLSVNASAGISESEPGAFAVDSAQGGSPRAVPSPAPAPPQITVQVQAMDSQSFLDHSDDIAMAVRQAMLQSSVLNDVIREV